MPQYGTLDVDAIAARAPVTDHLATESWSSEDTEVVNFVYELDNTNYLDMIPAALHPIDGLLVQAARTRLVSGDETAKRDLIALLLSDDLRARSLAIGALAQKYGNRRGYDPEGSLEDRRAALAEWSK